MAWPLSAKDLGNDPWGHPYVYKYPGEHGDEPDIISYGADGQPGGTDSTPTSSAGNNQCGTGACACSKRTWGVTLLEMLIVVAIIAVIASISFPALTAGLAGIRLASAAGSSRAFSLPSMNSVERREQAEAIVVSPKENARRLHRRFTANKPLKKLTMPPGIAIEGEEAAPLSAFPRRSLPPHRHRAAQERKAAADPSRSTLSPPSRNPTPGSRVQMTPG